MTNTSATGGPLYSIDTNGYLADDALEDFIQTWLTAVTALKGKLVRPVYQPDPPPLPDYGETWLAFNVKPGKLDWDASNTQFPPTDESDGASRTFRSQEIDVDLVGIGPNAGSLLTQFIMALGQGQNLEMLKAKHFAFVGANEPTITSIKSKARWQRRVDLKVSLRRTVQFTYAVLPVEAATGEIISDAPTVEIQIGPGSSKSGYGDVGYGL
jgi:hypothetical protein